MIIVTILNDAYLQVLQFSLGISGAAREVDQSEKACNGCKAVDRTISWKASSDYKEENNAVRPPATTIQGLLQKATHLFVRIFYIQNIYSVILCKNVFELEIRLYYIL